MQLRVLALARAECQSSVMAELERESERQPAFAVGPWRELAAGVYLATAEPESVNIGLVVGIKSALLVDTGSSPAQGRTIRESLSSVTDRRLAVVVVTHWHYDHSFGLTAFAGIPTIGHETVRAWLGSPEAATEAARLGVAVGELTAPERGIVVATAVDLGGRRVEIAHLGRGHTDGDLVVVVPDADLLFAGDLIESAGPPSFGPDSVPAEWAGTLDGLIGLMTEATRAVPGHGQPVGREFVFEQRGRIAAQAAELAAQRAVKPTEGRTLPLL
jgi:glyoxylase-like metal-dependent hydrolase (beta-lactamase superfamily II)